MNPIGALCVALLLGPAADGWVDLLADKTAWEVRDGAALEDWQWEAGTLTVKPGKGWLGTKKKYGDFEVEVEWKLPADGNSGVFLRVPDGDSKESPSKRGAEIQILDDESPMHKGKIKDWQYCGSIYTAAAATPGLIKQGDWNHFLIRCQGSKISVVVNGKPSAATDVDKGPLADRPFWGALGLQNHGSGCAFRKVRVRELQDAAWWKSLAGEYAVVEGSRNGKSPPPEMLAKMSVKLKPGQVVLIDDDHQESGNITKNPQDPPSVWRMEFPHGGDKRSIPLRVLQRAGGGELVWSKSEKQPPAHGLPAEPGWARLLLGPAK